MITTNPFPEPSKLPNVYAINLTSWGIIDVAGEDAKSYLHGQLTCEVNNADATKVNFGAHCDAKGKVHSVFRMLMNNNHIQLIQPLSCLNDSLANLQKFGVFSKVTIEQSAIGLLAIAGTNAEAWLKQQFSQIPDSLNQVIHTETYSLIYIASSTPRYLLIAPNSQLDAWRTTWQITFLTDAVWQYHEIIDGIPQVSTSSIGEYVPQMLNVQALGGISFTKGCYLGQETVARMQYLGQNKKALYCLSGKLSQAPLADDVIEVAMGENWKSAGKLLTSVVTEDGSCWLQAVLTKTLTENGQFRLKSQPDSELSLQTLPYSLEQ